MNNYRVHLYPVVHISVDVEAASPQDALRLAREEATPELDRLDGDVLAGWRVQWAGAYDGFLVDTLGADGNCIEDHAVEFDKNGKDLA